MTKKQCDRCAGYTLIELLELIAAIALGAWLADTASDYFEGAGRKVVYWTVATVGSALIFVCLLVGVGYLVGSIMYLRRGWKIVGVGRDALAYVERDKGRIIFGAELMGTGSVSRIITIPVSDWDTSVPAWASGRREEIVARIRSEMPEPRYKYIEK